MDWSGETGHWVAFLLFITGKIRAGIVMQDSNLISAFLDESHALKSEMVAEELNRGIFKRGLRLPCTMRDDVEGWLTSPEESVKAKRAVLERTLMCKETSQYSEDQRRVRRLTT